MAKRATMGQTLLGGDPITGCPELDRVLRLERRPRPTAEEEAEVAATVTRWFRRPLSPEHEVLLDAELAGDKPAAAAIRETINRERICDCMIPVAEGGHGKSCVLQLRPVQAWALLELGTERGMFGSIGTGWGKSAIDILAPLALPGCELALLLVPASLLSQLANMYRHLSNHWRVPSIRVHGKKPFRCEQPGDVPMLHVMAYTGLSSANASTFIENLAPDLIIADEAQAISDMDSARTKRLLRYFRDSETAGRDVRFACMTGTITDSSIMDYWPLITLALRERSPLPTDEAIARDWARALDASPWPAPPGALDDFDSTDDHIQTKYYRRLVETAGVISTITASSDVNIEIREVEPVDGVPDAIEELLQQVRQTNLRPDGMLFFEDKIAQWRCLHNLACGFYHRWVFTRGSDSEIDRYLDARKSYNREVRDVLEENRPRMDSPLLCARAAARFAEGLPDLPDAPAWDCWAYPEWMEVQGTVDYYSEAVRVDDFLAADVARWAMELPDDDKGVVWYESIELGLWITELSEGALPMLDGGVDAGDRMDRETGGRSIVASIKTHGTGRDGMQHKFRRQRYCQPFASSIGWEQGIARTARPGATRDNIIEIYGHTKELQDSLKKARERALYVQRTTGALQKLLAGSTGD